MTKRFRADKAAKFVLGGASHARATFTEEMLGKIAKYAKQTSEDGFQEKDFNDFEHLVRNAPVKKAKRAEVADQLFTAVRRLWNDGKKEEAERIVKAAAFRGTGPLLQERWEQLTKGE